MVTIRPAARRGAERVHAFLDRLLAVYATYLKQREGGR